MTNFNTAEAYPWTSALTDARVRVASARECSVAGGPPSPADRLPPFNSDAAALPWAETSERAGSPVTAGAQSSPLWRTIVHEAAGHAFVARFLHMEVAGCTAKPGPGYLGLTFGPASVRAKRGKEVYDREGDEGHDAVAVDLAARLSADMPGPGESCDGVEDIFVSIQQRSVELMAGAAAEMIFLGDAPPQFMACDLQAANVLARVICRTDASRSAFVEHCYQEALAIIEANRPVALALAIALLESADHTLDGQQIDQAIATAVAEQSVAADLARRAAWRETVERVANITK